ncbi:excalibur calcium-binding domain-containing protein [Peribacillus frigoritolerans]|uniref:excalibur calcium-binding domain-containing protein n=1 Tax=Peribacillus frigoritolerans TaxID=450367 RepID=UPI0029F574D4|nr:excalibur calcium-binding domain-containing protein [Peribacillus frigoritolerans]
MQAIALLGFLAFSYAFLYLIYHFIKKVKNKERTLSKKIYYPFLIGGIIFFIVGISFLDTGIQAQLDDKIEKNAKLTADNKTLKLENTKLEKQITDLESKIKETDSNITEYENNLKSLEEEKKAFSSEKDSLKKQISDLSTKNTNLQNEVDNLHTQLASKDTYTSSSKTNTNQSPASASLGEREDFANCTDLRGTYPNGVPAGHPAYVPSMDRDKDNYACEK